MKVKLLRDARIVHKAGEILEVSPEECHFLVSTAGAEVVDAVKTAPKPVETPEEKLPAPEVPEKKVVIKKATAVKKPAAKKK